jgi:hypothetical protein
MILERKKPGVLLRMSLRELARDNRPLRLFLNYCALRERTCDTTVPRFIQIMASQGAVVVLRAEVYEIFRQLESIGCGRFFKATSKREARFKWGYSLKDLGQALSDNS